jgi:hypothetical protein
LQARNETCDDIQPKGLEFNQRSRAVSTDVTRETLNDCDSTDEDTHSGGVQSKSAVSEPDETLTEACKFKNDIIQFVNSNFLWSLDLACKPMIEMLTLEEGKFKTFVIDSCFGLQGTQTLRQYPCLLDQSRSAFYVGLSDTDITVFTKNTFMNLANFAEKLDSKQIVFLLDRDHRQKSAYKRMFDVTDCKRLNSEKVKALIKNDNQSAVENLDQAASKQKVRAVLSQTAFYKLML